jgi:hypothetical protein
MLRLLESQISSSFRQSFTPIYHRTIIPTLSFPRSSNGHCKISHPSPGRRSSVFSHRKKDSETNQTNIFTSQDVQNHLSIPPVYKQHRQSVVPTN